MEYSGRPLRSTKRLANTLGERPAWYRITNAASAALPTQVSIYDEIGMFGVNAGSFLADLKGVNGDIELHISSPGGDVFDGIAIYNQLKQRKGAVTVVVDSLAASAASFIAMAASPGKLEMAPHSQMMIHNGFSMAIGDANDLRQTADLLDKITTEIASIYAERTGKPVAYWLAKMAAETWYSDQEAVDDGLADCIHGQPSPANGWDLSVYGKTPAKLANGTPPPSKKCPECDKYNAPGAEKCASCGKPFPGDDDAKPAAGNQDGTVVNADADTDAKPLGSDGWVQDPDGTVRFDPDGDGDDDSTPEGDTDHDYFAPDGTPIKPVPPKPAAGNLADLWPVLNASVDNSPWDGSKAMANGAASDDPAKFYAGICAGRKAGDPANQASWALPYKYHPGDAVNAAGVKAALSSLPKTEGLTNATEAKSTLEKAMKAANPDYDPDALIDPATLAAMFTIKGPEVDNSTWDADAAMAAAAANADPEWYFAGICAGRLPGDPSNASAWALPFKYSPSSPPNASGVRAALAQLPCIDGLANTGEARGLLDKAMKAISPDPVPDDEIDPDLLVAAFAIGLKGAGK